MVAFVTFYFQRRQLHLAEHRFRLDLFEKRYAKLLDAKKLIEIVSEFHEFGDIRNNLIRELYVSLDEGRFLLSHQTNNFLKKICDAAETYLMSLGERQSLNHDDIYTWTQSAETLARKLSVLRVLYAQIPEQFEGDLHIEAS